MPANDVYRVTTLCTSGGQEFVNVYHYLGLTADATTENIAQAFAIQKLLGVIDILHFSADFQYVLCENVNGIEPPFVEPTANVNGTQQGESMPTFTTFSYELIVSSAIFRNGRKAFGPIAEGDVQDNIANPGMLATLDNLAATLLAPIQFGGVDMAQLGLYRDNQLGVSYTPVTNVAYKRVSTQNSRKIL